MKIFEKIKIPEYIREKFDKYKYVLLVCVIGLGLILLPTGTKENPGTQPSQATAQTEYDPSALAAALEEVFASVDGVGQAKVVLTLKSGYESVYVYNESYSDKQQGENSEASAQMQLVTIGSGSTAEPVVEKINSPTFLGAVVICDGGDSPKVQLELTNAVRSLTGISSNNIVILKMKQ